MNKEKLLKIKDILIKMKTQMKVESKQKLNQINIKIYSLKVNPEKKLDLPKEAKIPPNFKKHH